MLQKINMQGSATLGELYSLLYFVIYDEFK